MGRGCSIGSFISTHLNKTIISHFKPSPFIVSNSVKDATKLPKRKLSPRSQLYPPSPSHPNSSYILSVCLLIVPRIHLFPSPLPLLEHLLSSEQLPELPVSSCSPSRPFSKLARSKVSLLCLTLHAPYCPHKVEPLCHDF